MGYPDWWDDLQKRKAATKAPAHRTGGKDNLASADHPGEITSSYSGMDLNEREAAVVEQGASKQKKEREKAENHTERGRRERVTENPTYTPLYTKTLPNLIQNTPGPNQISSGPNYNPIPKFSLISHKYPNGSLIVVLRTL